MRGGISSEAQHLGSKRSHGKKKLYVPDPVPRRPDARRIEARRVVAEKRAQVYVGKKQPGTRVYLLRRVLAGALVFVGVLALVVAVYTASTEAARGRQLPIEPDVAGPGTVLAEAGSVGISSPVRPEELTGLGYHPEGESLAELSPRGQSLSGTGILALFGMGSTPEEIKYHLMDPASRLGPRTGALDVGAEAGTTVYAPVDGIVTAIRPDPVLPEGANVVEIRPADDPNARVSVSLVQDISDEVGPKTPVEAGKTELGEVADSARFLKPQLATEVKGTGAGNHVTVSASRMD
jgi:hypothetical protein